MRALWYIRVISDYIYTRTSRDNNSKPMLGILQGIDVSCTLVTLNGIYLGTILFCPVSRIHSVRRLDTVYF